MAGVIYVVFARIIFHVVPADSRTAKLLWVPGKYIYRIIKSSSGPNLLRPARWITPIFVTFDILALFLQATGAAMVAGVQGTDTSAKDQMNRGKTLAQSGIGIQLAAFGLFSIIAARFHFTSKQFTVAFNSRLLRAEGDKMATLEGSTKAFKPNWRTLLFVVNASCVLIIVCHLSFLILKRDL